MKKLRNWDPVIVIAWKYKNKISKIENIDGDKLYVKGVNEVKRAMKGKGFVKKHLPIHVSNVMYYLEAEKKPTRIKITTDKKWKKTRTATKTDKSI